MDQIAVKIKGDTFKLYINDLLHIFFDLKDLKGIQSWKEGKNWFKIEFTLKDCTILTAYDDMNRWIKILEEIDKYIT